MAKPPIPKAFPVIVSDLDPCRASLDWLDRIAARAQARLDADPDRPGAAHLREAVRYAALARGALASGSAEGAALATLGVMQHAWEAELSVVRERKVIRAGLDTLRARAEGGAASGRARRGKESKRVTIERLLAEYKGDEQARVATVARRVPAAKAYVRRILRERQAKG